MELNYIYVQEIYPRERKRNEIKVSPEITRPDLNRFHDCGKELIPK
jgi:hypothetical protein